MILRSLLSPATKRHVESRVLQTHPQHLFRIIQDVDHYSEFLPLCWSSKVLLHDNHQRIEKMREHSFRATLTVGMPPLQETYVSHVHVIPETLTVETKSVESKLFDSLSSRWQLTPNKNSPNESVHVDFEVELTVSDPFVVGLLDQLLIGVAGQQVEAFAKRCQQLPLPPDLC